MGIARNVRDLVGKEPWRAGQGLPRNALDSLWREDHPICLATVDDLEWEENSHWWWCRKCGHCSNAHVIKHRVAEHPDVLHKRALAHFIAKRIEQGMTAEVATQQALHLQACVLKAAADISPESVGSYINKHVLTE